ncbi:sterol desaturase family protein [Methylotuvimicrobium buryatense]|uniref:DUF2934 domain-containing protein n=1 Tax=Methylotuvimicrobium buryatense TaxID=95641 RepID=A0A4V1IK16_METBY|nr:sterol desaturase family protein [Methylotuvimicrobium buryatense]QCW83335.1 DUF2934 domain-containing protein [Methylotuvimicrobium buryatense]
MTLTMNASMNLFDAVGVWSMITSFDLAGFSILMFFIILFIIETHRPRKKLPTHELKNSYRVNITLFLFNSLVLSIMSIASLLIVAEHFSGAGILSGMSNAAIKAALSLLLLDLVFYFWHKACHDFDGLWLFHKVHHSEPHLNVSTAYRVHILEILAVTLIKVLSIVIFGFDKASVLAYELLMMLFVMFHHANIAFSREQNLGYLFITPYLHRVHHSTVRVEHDRNYGAVFSIWDRLFGTLAELEPKQIGINGKPPLTFLKLLKFGVTQRPKAIPFDVRQETMPMIAEAAYFKAEKRGFEPGNEMYDWLEAEQDIARKLYTRRSVMERLCLE